VPTSIGWSDIAVRLALTVLAGTIIGLNRSERGRAAGLRTTLLVCLAASFAMIQTNVLLGTRGKLADSFAQFDVMRLPLGILTGVGFIGAGVILRRDGAVVGVTTAATMWFVTVVGLCFGGGQIGIGLTALALGIIVLWCFRWIEKLLRKERSASLTLVLAPQSHLEDEIKSHLTGFDVRIISWATGARAPSGQRTLRCEVRWEAPARERNLLLPQFLGDLASRSDVLALDWDTGSQGETMDN
jgi:putative Mg2+ transporter-C (MgtC) family protein